MLDDSVKKIAQQIVSGEIDIFAGCDEIARICEAQNFPDVLMEMYHLSHLKDGHEEFGFKRDNMREDIIKEAEKLLESQGHLY